MLTLESASRAGCLAIFSIVAGAIIGIAAAAASLVPDALVWGIFLGVPIGAIVSPAIVAGLFRKSLGPATLIVFVPSLTVAIAGGLASGPPLTLASVVVFCAMAGFLLRRPPRHRRMGPPGAPRLPPLRLRHHRPHPVPRVRQSGLSRAATPLPRPPRSALTPHLRAHQRSRSDS